MKKIIFTILACFLFLGCSNKTNDELKVGDEIVLNGVNGGKKILKRVEHGFVLKGEEDKILMIDFFGTFCPPCKEEAPSLTDYQIKYKDKLAIIGLNIYEDVKDEYVLENFIKKFNAYYFIANSKQSLQISELVAKDINYKKMIVLPFKVVLKGGKYQILTDVWEGKKDNKFYIGGVGTDTMEKDLKQILTMPTL